MTEGDPQIDLLHIPSGRVHISLGFLLVEMDIVSVQNKTPGLLVDCGRGPPDHLKCIRQITVPVRFQDSAETAVIDQIAQRHTGIGLYGFSHQSLFHGHLFCWDSQWTDAGHDLIRRQTDGLLKSLPVHGPADPGSAETFGFRKEHDLLKCVSECFLTVGGTFHFAGNKGIRTGDHRALQTFFPDIQKIPLDGKTVGVFHRVCIVEDFFCGFRFQRNTVKSANTSTVTNDIVHVSCSLLVFYKIIFCTIKYSNLICVNQRIFGKTGKGI